MISLALLEVMDKEPSLFTVWVAAAGFGAIGFWSARRWVWPAFPLLAWDLFSLATAHEELADPFVGPAILHEAGATYGTQTYVAHALCIAATAAGLAWGLARSWRREPAAGQTSAPGAVP